MKKSMKKFFALLATLCMMLAFNVTAFAANPTVTEGDCAIDVTNLKTGGSAQHVDAYQVYEWDSTNNQFKLTENFKSSGLPDNIDDATLPEGLTAGDITGLDITNINADAQADSDTAGKASLTDLNRGLYLVIATDPDGDVTYNRMVANTYTYSSTSGLITDGKSTVVAKYDKTELTKEDNDANKAVYLGQELEYTISDTIKPDTSEFVINDTLNGADFVTNSWSLSIGGKSYEINTTDENSEIYMKVTTDEETHAQSFVLTIKNTTKDKYTGKITLTYNATVNQYAFTTSDTGVITNKVTDTNNSTGVETKDYTTTIKMDKTDADGKALTGAKFALKNANGQYAKVVSEGNGVYRITGTWDKDSVTESDTDYILDMSDVSSVTVKGVDVGTYTFVEIKAPAGYSINSAGGTATVTFTDSNDNGIVDDAKELVVTNPTGTNAVKDTKLSELPSTGGIGTYLFTIGGVALMAVAAVMIVAKKRREEA